MAAGNKQSRKTAADNGGSAEARARPEPSTQAILRHWHEAVPDDRMAHLVRDAARGLTRALQFRLGEHSVSMGHWVFLRILWDEDGLSQRELAARAGLMESTTHTALRRMEALGFVERRKQAGDRKKVHVYLSAAGRALERRLVPLAEEVNAVALQDVAAEDIAVTRRTLLTMIQRLAEDEARLLEAGYSIPSTRSMTGDRDRE